MKRPALAAAALAATLIAAQVAAADSQRPVTIALWAVQASTEGREEPHFDRGLAEIREAVADLSFDTYRALKTGRERLAIGQERRIPLNQTYALRLNALSRERDGRIRLEVRVEMQPPEPGSRVVNVISTRIMLAPGKKITIGGARLEQGELVVVLEARD